MIADAHDWTCADYLRSCRDLTIELGRTVVLLWETRHGKW